MRTPVYVKMDAPEQLLLSEGVCRQLGVITYHTEVQPIERVKADKPTRVSKTAKEDDCVIPTVRVHLVKDVRILPNECLTTQVKLEGEIKTSTQSMIIEADPALLQDREVQMVDAVLQPTKDGMAQVSLINCLGLTQKLKGDWTLAVHILWKCSPQKGRTTQRGIMRWGQAQWMNLWIVQHW